MQRLTPNTVLQNRFVLKEELSFEPQKGQQVWAVQDRQTGQALIARLHADGRAEWYSDNRRSIKVEPEQIPISPPPVAAPVGSQRIPPALVSEGKWLRSVLVTLLVLALMLIGYFYRKPIVKYGQAFRASLTPATAVDPADTITQASLVTTAPGQTERVARAASTATPISVSQAVRLLSVLERIPAEKHPAIFADARLAFETLRRTPGRAQTIDSIYTMCVGRGAQSLMAHQQNGDSISKTYALEWYRTAYALKPLPYLRERLNRLANVRPKAPIRHETPAKKSRTRDPLFIDDPEVNH